MNHVRLCDIKTIIYAEVPNRRDPSAEGRKGPSLGSGGPPPNHKRRSQAYTPIGPGLPYSHTPLAWVDR